MIITWDESKRKANIAKHGLDFAALDEAFFQSATIYPSRDRRRVAVGFVGATLVVAVVFRPLGTEALSIVSMRPASKKERAYAKKNA